MLQHDADALDAAQDALVAAVRALPRFDGRSSFGTWLYRITTNTCLDELRRRRRRPVVGLGGAEGEASGEALPRSGGGPWHRDPAEVVADRIDVDAALRALPEEFRVVVVLRDVADLPYDEIADILTIPIGTVRSRLARGRAALADHVGNAEAPDVVQTLRPMPGGSATPGPQRPEPPEPPASYRQEEHSR